MSRHGDQLGFNARRALRFIDERQPTAGAAAAAGAGAGAGGGFLQLRVQGFQESGVDFAAEGFLAPTNADEHILCWALHLARAQAHGGCGRPVALLTEDLALKIKANASGVACDTAGAMAALPAARLPTATPLSSAPNAGTVLVEDPSLRHRAAAPPQPAAALPPPAAAPPSAYAMQIARHLAERAAAERAAAERAAAEKAAAERAAARVAVVGGSEAPRSALLPPPTLPIAPPPLLQHPSSRPVPAAAPVALRRGAASVGALTLTSGSVAEMTTAAAETLTPPLTRTRTRTLRPNPKA